MMSEELRTLLETGEPLDPATDAGKEMNRSSSQVREICSVINRESSDADRIRELFSELTGRRSRNPSGSSLPSPPTLGRTSR